jgi:hypothetical protein
LLDAMERALLGGPVQIVIGQLGAVPARVITRRRRPDHRRRDTRRHRQRHHDRHELHASTMRL